MRDEKSEYSMIEHAGVVETLAGHDAVLISASDGTWGFVVEGFPEGGLDPILEQGLPTRHVATWKASRACEDLSSTIPDAMRTRRDRIRKVSRTRADIALTGDDRIRGALLSDLLGTPPEAISIDQAVARLNGVVEELEGEIEALDFLSIAAETASARRREAASFAVVVIADGEPYVERGRTWQEALSLCMGHVQSERATGGIAVDSAMEVRMVDASVVEDEWSIDDVRRADVSTSVRDLLREFERVHGPGRGR